MKKLILIGLVLTVPMLASAGPMTWSKPLVSAADSTLGADQKADKNKAAMEEIRTRIKAMGVFAGYTTQGN